jgi:hypothetical protein
MEEIGSLLGTAIKVGGYPIILMPGNMIQNI